MVAGQPELHHHGGHTGVQALHDEAGLTRLIVSSYQAVSGGGINAVHELSEQLAKTVDRAAELFTFDGSAVNFRPLRVPGAHRVQRDPVAVQDRRRRVARDGRRAEVRGRRRARSSACPTSRSRRRVSGCRCSPATRHRWWAEFERPISPERATEVLAAAPEWSWPSISRGAPLMAAGRDVSYVGRIRRAHGGFQRTGLLRRPATTCARAPPSTSCRSPKRCATGAPRTAPAQPPGDGRRSRRAVRNVGAFPVRFYVGEMISLRA